MKKIFILLIIVCFLFVSCGKSVDCSFDSGLFGGENDVYTAFLSSGALFAYEIDTTQGQTIQKIYIWDNLLRRQLWQDLVALSQSVPQKDKVITIENGTDIKINNKTIDFEATSDLSYAVLNAVLPTRANVNALDFYWNLRWMFIALETLEKFGDTEVIVIETMAESAEAMLLKDHRSDQIQFVFALQEVPELQNLLE